MIAIINIFLVSSASGAVRSVTAALTLTGFILLGILMTLFVSYILSKTVLKGVPSSFTLELPPYRRPQPGKIIVRSICDRTLFVLKRAVIVAIPAGLLIWIMANVFIDGVSLLKYCSGFLDPFARIFGLDGVILLAFILGLPANEIVLPIIIMSYGMSGSLTDIPDLASLGQMLSQNGWTWVTALNVTLFTLFHWPCGTTCLTIKKETGSFKWTLASILVPTACGLALCFLTASSARLIEFLISR